MTVRAIKAGFVPGEKRGNTSWAQCPACEGWFHVGAPILSRPDIDLHCPHCHKEFMADQAAQLLKVEA